MVEKDMLIVVSIPVFRKNCRYFVCIKRFVEYFGVGDVCIVGYTSIFRNLLMVERRKKVCLILFACISAPKRVINVRSVLIAIIPTAIKIVELESKSPLLACINRKQCLELVFAISSVARRTVR